MENKILDSDLENMVKFVKGYITSLQYEFNDIINESENSDEAIKEMMNFVSAIINTPNEEAVKYIKESMADNLKILN